MPVSDGDFALEQDYCLIRYKAGGFDIEQKIMRTAFAQRIDKQRNLDDSLDADYYNNM